jgi:hypothetical protein
MCEVESRFMNKTCSSGDRTRNKRVLYAALEARFERTGLHWAAAHPWFALRGGSTDAGRSVGLMSAPCAARWLNEVCSSTVC